MKNFMTNNKLKFGSQQPKNPISWAVKYNKDDLLKLIKESLTMTDEEKKDFTATFNSNEDIWETGAVLYKILMDEAESFKNNKWDLREAILKAQLNTKKR
jgi:hypothetical protein